MNPPAPVPFAARIGLVPQLRHFAAVGLVLGLIFILELVLLSTFGSVRSGLYKPFKRSFGLAPLSLVTVLVAVAVLIAYAAVLKRRYASLPRANFWFIIAVAAILDLGFWGLVWLPAIEVVGNFLPPIAGSLLALVITGVVALIAGAVVIKQRHEPSSRVTLWFSVAVATILVLGLCCTAWLPPIVVGDLTPPVWFYFLLVAVGVPAAAIWTIRWLNRRSRWGILAGYLVLAPVYAYLVTDDATIHRTTTVEEIAPAFPGAEKSYEVLMRYGKNHPLGKNWRSPNRIWRNNGYADASEPEKFRRFIAVARADIEADWAELAPVRAWWSELAAFDRIGDLTPSGPNAELMGFQSVRSYSQLANFTAGIQALAGQGDAAFATLQPLVEVSRKLEPSSRTLVRSMIALVVKTNALDAVNFVLDTTPVSAVARARMAAALTGGVGGEAGARRLIAIESISTMIMLEEPEIYGPFFPNLRRAKNLIYNPRRTSNVLGEFVAEQQDLAARRDTEKMESSRLAFLEGKGGPHFKNFLGGVVLHELVPSMHSVIKSYWKAEDKRTALLEKLNQP